MKTFNTHIMVRGYELDSYGHVNNAVYLQYFEQARWEMMRELKFLDHFTKNGLLIVVTESNVRYMREACLFDELVIETTYEKRHPYLVFHQKIRNENTQIPITRATVKTLIIDKMRVAQDLPDILPDAEQNKTYHGKK